MIDESIDTFSFKSLLLRAKGFFNLVLVATHSKRFLSFADSVYNLGTIPVGSILMGIVDKGKISIEYEFNGERQMIEQGNLTDTLTIQEMADRYGITRRTATRYIEDCNLVTGQKVQRGKTVITVDIDEATHQLILERIEENKGMNPSLSMNDSIRHLSPASVVSDQVSDVYRNLYERAEEENQSLADQVSNLRTELEQLRIEAASIKAREQATQELITSLKETIAQAKITNEALNNERVAINQQLVKYREKESDQPRKDSKPAFWQFWMR